MVICVCSVLPVLATAFAPEYDRIVAASGQSVGVLLAFEARLVQVAD